MGDHMSKGGRPRRSGPREPNGRLQRPGVQRELTEATGIWSRFCLWAQPPSDPLTDPATFWDNRPAKMHPLLKQIKAGKFDVDSFCVAMDWAAVSMDVFPAWHVRGFLAKRTGFDFASREGRAAARRYAQERFDAAAIE